MRNNETFWKTSEIVLGAVGAAFLILILVLKIIGKDVTVLTYPMVGIVILFLVCDEFARSIRRRRDKDEAAKEEAEHPSAPEPELPEEAFTFDESSDQKQP